MLYNFCISQNLIPNPSFEDENVCVRYHENCSPAAWRSTTLKQFLYPEYLAHQRKSTAIIPPDGNRFIGLRVFNTKRKFDRSIIQVPLLCVLEKGKKYNLSFYYLSGAFWINSFHIQFVDTLQIHNDNTLLIKNPSQITIDFQKPHEQKKWLNFETIYEAKGDEVGFILGNLKSDEATEVHLFEKRKDKDKARAYYYFDNFSLTPLKKDTLCDLAKNQSFIYCDSIRHLRENPILDITMQQEETPIVMESKIDTPIDSPIIQETNPMVATEISTEKVFTMKYILFENNSKNLLPIAHSSLQNLVSFLKKNTHLNVIITGHTDNVGKEIANLLLSEKRAQSVANFLIQSGVNFNRITTVGKGETQPITENITPIGRSQNRRVEFQLINP